MDEYYNILKKYWGFTDFRPQQLNIIDSIEKLLN